MSTVWLSSTKGYLLFRSHGRLRLKCDGTCAETRLRLSAKRTSPFKSVGGGGGSVQSTTGSRVVCISGSNAGYTMFRGSVKSTDYPLHSPVSPSVRHLVPSHFNWTLTLLIFLSFPPKPNGSPDMCVEGQQQRPQHATTLRFARTGCLCYT